MADKVVFVQFGTGKFIRGYFDWMLSKIKKDTHVIAFQSTPHDNYQTLQMRGYKYRVILKYKKFTIDEVSVIKNILPIYKNADLLNILEEKIDFIVSNTSEEGIKFDKNKIKQSYPFKLAEFLYKRYAFHRDDSITIVPLELIANNGEYLKSKLIEISNTYFNNNFRDWILTKCEFVNTVVDCIVDSQMANLDVEREAYYAFYLSNNDKLKELFKNSGLNIFLSDDAEKIFDMKVKILNGLHTFFVCSAYLEGKTTVYDTITDVRYRKLADEVFYNEIIHTIDFDKTFLENFYIQTIKRFENPYLEHSLCDIEKNTFEKFYVRIAKTIVEYESMFGKKPKLLSMAFENLKKLYPNNPILDNFESYYESFKDEKC